jgi:hypothetical protein
MLSLVETLVDARIMYSVERYSSLLYESCLVCAAEAREVLEVGILTEPFG